jgi:hypothetical protein
MATTPTSRTFIYLFMCGLFNDVVCSSDIVASNERIINEQLIGKYMEGSGRDLI